MNNQQPTPAIVAQHAVRRFPKLALWLLCATYIIAGYVGRAPWKSADITAFGYMLELIHSGLSAWSWPGLTPLLSGVPPEIDSPLGYALGAWSISLFSDTLHALQADTASRLPFIALLAISFICTRYSVYYLAISPKAKPIAFAFGGQAQPKDYALALADAAVLALIATLGLARIGHESTPCVAQLGMSSALMLGLSMTAQRPYKSLIIFGLSLFGLCLLGAPSLAVITGLAGALVCALDKDTRSSKQNIALMFLLCVGAAVMSQVLNLWHWRIAPLEQTWRELPSLGRLWIWFCWPVWPLSIWTLWRWRNQWASPNWSRHLILPLVQCLIITTAALITYAQEKTLVLALPCMTALGVFALPTLSRGVKALIEWFTLLLFSACGFVIWVIWIAYQTGWPAQPARNVARLIPGFIPHFDIATFALAGVVTLFWVLIVVWRIRRNPTALWKSLILPGAGAALNWVLVMSLWMPPIDYGRSYAALSTNVLQAMQTPNCAFAWKLTPAQTTALQYHGHLQLFDLSTQANAAYELNSPSQSFVPPSTNQNGSHKPACEWLLVSGEHKGEINHFNEVHASSTWRLFKTLRKPSDPEEDVVIFKYAP